MTDLYQFHGALSRRALSTLSILLRYITFVDFQRDSPVFEVAVSSPIFPPLPVRVSLVDVVSMHSHLPCRCELDSCVGCVHHSRGAVVVVGTRSTEDKFVCHCFSAADSVGGRTGGGEEEVRCRPRDEVQRFHVLSAT